MAEAEGPVTGAPIAPAPATPSWDGLVGTGALQGALGRPDVCVLDCRYDLARPQAGQEQFAAGHVSGARYVSLEHDLAGPRGAADGRHPLPAPEEFAARLGAWGIDSQVQVVAYDASEGSFAARLWWMLRWLGHERVAVLDGGWPAWLAAGLPVSQAPAPARPARRFSVREPLALARTVEEVQALSQALRQGRDGGLIVDARAADRYAGRNETIDPVAGHIPGAINRFWKLNLAPDGRFKDRATLRADYDALLAGRDPADLTMQCGSGVTACHNLLAMHVAGLAGARLYPGSWSQWITDPRRPVAVGPAP